MIFVVEDEIFYQKLIKANLNKFNFNKIKTFFSGEECLEKISEKPDFLILDYQLSGKNGIEVLKEFKETSPDTHVIFLSGKREMDIANKSMEMGADSFIVKNNQSFQKIKQRIHSLSSFNKLRQVRKITKMFLIGIAALVATTIVLHSFYPDLF
ncbi:MAG: hypothetical protein A2W91_10390 [Bacteroidetes bacterium GWF2_38_335]|nr:MAG: hypothetical protein A2W91_10390 [Bacteroidetes bacterium GWF2_38_335]OFY81888.1 MAG: hypothetical protein A2281_06650 [Bacteroidetes bacterium RIFOXYA12_FULL_38_20]